MRHLAYVLAVAALEEIGKAELVKIELTDGGSEM
jgi:hypothetical protein